MSDFRQVNRLAETHPRGKSFLGGTGIVLDLKSDGLTRAPPQLAQPLHKTGFNLPSRPTSGYLYVARNINIRRAQI